MGNRTNNVIFSRKRFVHHQKVSRINKGERVKGINKYFSVIQKTTELNPIYKKPDYGWVLMFHEINDDITNKSNIESNFSLSTDSFWDLIDRIKDFVIFSSIESILNVKEKRQVFITFDDVCFSAYYNVMRELDNRKIPFCCFVSPNLINKEGYINHDDLEWLLSSRYCSVHSHGMNHILLRGLDYDSIRREIYESKKWIIENSYELSMRDLFFAYPYGSKYAVTKKAMKVCQNSGYKYAFGTFNLPLNKRFISKNCFFLPRVNVNEMNYVKIIKRILS